MLRTTVLFFFFFGTQWLPIKIFPTLLMMTLIIYWKIIEIPRWIIKYLSININVMIKYINHLHRLIYQKLNDWSKMMSSRKSSCIQFTQKKDTHKSWSRENRKKDVKRWKGRYTKVKKRTDQYERLDSLVRYLEDRPDSLLLLFWFKSRRWRRDPVT